MTFLEPQRLVLLFLVAALAAWYGLGRNRRSAYPVTLSTLRFAAEAEGRLGRRWRRHLPAAMFLVLLLLLVTGFARPARDVRVPTKAGNVIVALDSSVSMHAVDVAPSRLVAARKAAAGFVRSLPRGIRIGVVTFDGSARLLLAPTRDRAKVRAALRAPTDPRGGTAIGDALAASTGALVRQRALDTVDRAGNGKPLPWRVVMLSDGENTAGRPVSVALEAAADRGVPVDTIAFGTPLGTVILNGHLIEVPVSGETLEQVAEATGGTAHDAGSAKELSEAYDDIALAVGSRTVRRDVSPWFAAAAAAWAVLALAVGLRRSPALPSGRGWPVPRRTRAA